MARGPTIFLVLGPTAVLLLITPSLFIYGELFNWPADELLLARAIDAARRHRHAEAAE